MIRFVIGPESGGGNASLRYALFELGVRLNVRFTIQNELRTIHPEDVVVGYGEDSIPASSHGRIVRLHRASPEQKCHPQSVDGRWCHGSVSNGRLDIVAGTASLLSFDCESDVQRDHLGRISSAVHPLKDWFCEPLLENNATYLRDEIERNFGELKPISRPFGTKRSACVLTHDVDGPQLHTLFAICRSFLLALRGSRDEMESFKLGVLTLLTGQRDPYWNFEEWAKLEHKWGGRSTFYVYPGPTPSARRQFRDPHYNPARRPFPPVLKDLASRGWEIGVHHGIGAHGLAAYTESREALNRILGSGPKGCRTHYWAGVWRDPYRAWRDMEQSGFSYDASLSPLTLGYRTGNMLPTMPSMRWRLKADDGFVVLPTALMDAYANPRLSPLNARQIETAWQRLLENLRKDGLLVADWHVRTLINAGAHRGQLTAFMSTVWSLGTDSDIALMTAEQAAECWRAHCSRCWVEEP